MPRLIAAQLNSIVGDIEGNTQRIINALTMIKEHNHSAIVCFPEMVICGYPPQDLLLRDYFIEACQAALHEILPHTQHLTAILGCPRLNLHQQRFNSAYVLSEQKIIACYDKQCLPNYALFDEQRYFTPGHKTTVVTLDHLKLGILICEDLWQPEPIAAAQQAGAECIVCLNASPYALQKQSQRQRLLQQRAQQQQLPILYTNLVGGQDEMVFDGYSTMVNAQGQTLAQAPGFRTDHLEINLKAATHEPIGKPLSPPNTREEADLYHALMLGIHDYVRKNSFECVLVGLSGGIDSALTLALCCDALGAAAIEAILMPTCYTREISHQGAEQQLKTQGIKHRIISIENLRQTYIETLRQGLDTPLNSVTEENIQARIRGNILMAAANNSGALVISTGNRSEYAVGYSTLYGDMAGGFAPLKDVLKTQVYQLARWRNREEIIIPQGVIDRAPSAELRANQCDQDTLPDYAILDQIIVGAIDQQLSREQLIANGLPAEAVNDTLQRIRRNEYKRRQAAPGIRIGDRAFGKDRRYPITNYFDA